MDIVSPSLSEKSLLGAAALLVGASEGCRRLYTSEGLQ